MGCEKKEPKNVTTTNESHNIVRNYRQEDAWHFCVVSIKIDEIFPPFFKKH